jgi:hypothetical protein
MEKQNVSEFDNSRATSELIAIAPEKSELENIIPPEVFNDEFYFSIIELTRSELLTNILEIGSSSGGGSTEAFVRGLDTNPQGTLHTHLYCMELSKPRFKALRNAYKNYPFVHCFNVSSVPLESFPSLAEVATFYRSQRTPLNNYPLEQVLGWLTQDIEYVRNAGVATNGIRMIKQSQGISAFDMVMIDGSEFTGKAELNEVYGARWILLDDVCVFKNFENYNRLKNDTAYILYRENLVIRNGYAIFRLK